MSTTEQFNKKGTSIGAVAGTVYVDLAKTNFPNASLKTFNEEADMLSAIAQDEIDALITIDQVIDLTFKNHPDKVFKSSETPMAVFGE